MIRLRRLLAMVATSAILMLGAVIALEALGLLFQRQSPEPAPVIANINVPDVPEETAPALLMKQLEEQERAEAKVKAEQAKEEQLRQEAERLKAAAEAEEAARKLAEAGKLEAEKAAQKVAALGPPPVMDAPPQPEVREPTPQEGARNAKLTPSARPEQGKRTLHLTPGRREQARRARRSAARAGSTRCPFLAWWETVVMGAPEPGRRAT